MLTLQTYAHTIRDEEMGLSIADFTTDSSTERPYTAPDILDGAAKGNAPDLTDRGRFERLEHETGLEPAEALAVASSATAPPPRWQGDAGVDFIEEFRLNRSYRVVSINSGGSAGGGNRVSEARRGGAARLSARGHDAVRSEPGHGHPHARPQVPGSLRKIR